MINLPCRSPLRLFQFFCQRIRPSAYLFCLCTQLAVPVYVLKVATWLEGWLVCLGHRRKWVGEWVNRIIDGTVNLLKISTIWKLFLKRCAVFINTHLKKRVYDYNGNFDICVYIATYITDVPLFLWESSNTLRWTTPRGQHERQTWGKDGQAWSGDLGDAASVRACVSGCLVRPRRLMSYPCIASHN